MEEGSEEDSRRTWLSWDPDEEKGVKSARGREQGIVEDNDFILSGFFSS